MAGGISQAVTFELAALCLVERVGMQANECEKIEVNSPCRVIECRIMVALVLLIIRKGLQKSRAMSVMMA